MEVDGIAEKDDHEIKRNSTAKQGVTSTFQDDFKECRLLMIFYPNQHHKFRVGYEEVFQSCLGLGVVKPDTWRNLPNNIPTNNLVMVDSREMLGNISG